MLLYRKTLGLTSKMHQEVIPMCPQQPALFSPLFHLCHQKTGYGAASPPELSYPSITSDPSPRVSVPTHTSIKPLVGSAQVNI